MKKKLEGQRDTEKVAKEACQGKLTASSKKNDEQEAMLASMSMKSLPVSDGFSAKLPMPNRARWLAQLLLSRWLNWRSARYSKV